MKIILHFVHDNRMTSVISTLKYDPMGREKGGDGKERCEAK